MITAADSDGNAGVEKSLPRSSMSYDIAADSDGNVGVEKGLCTRRSAMSFIIAVDSNCTAMLEIGYIDQMHAYR